MTRFGRVGSFAALLATVLVGWLALPIDASKADPDRDRSALPYATALIADPAVDRPRRLDSVDAAPFSLPRDLPWVSVSRNGRYFITDDGRPFIRVGNQAGTGSLDF